MTFLRVEKISSNHVQPMSVFMSYSILVTCPRNMEYLLEAELRALGVDIERVSPLGVSAQMDLSLIYRVSLWSRLANRILVRLFSGEVNNVAALSQLCSQFDWSTVFTVDRTLAIDYYGESSFIKNTMFGAQLIKDAIVDHFKPTGSRPSVDKQKPNIRLQAHWRRGELTVSLDVVGYSLHQRGYRQQTGRAPLKENIAAAVLVRAGWPELLAQGAHFVDPFCGSGTLLIEAALMAGNLAPGLFRQDQSFPYWQQHDDTLWQSIRQQAVSVQKPIVNTFYGFDQDAKMIALTQSCVNHLGLEQRVVLKQQPIAALPDLSSPGLMVSNPPYGERLDSIERLIPVYQALGKALHTHCQGYQAAILTTEPLLAKAIGLQSHKHYQFYNGPLKATLYCFDIQSENQYRAPESGQLRDQAMGLLNRIKKNQKRLSPWLKRGISNCYRLYDADLPEYAFAVDVYGDWVHVQEYKPPKSIPEHKAKLRVIEMLQVLPQVLDIPTKHLVLKQRQRQKGTQQYQPLARDKKTHVVREGHAKIKVNLHDYLDTGLFLDHRRLRLVFADSLAGKSLLNCFCYTGVFSVQAALGGATTCNVDLSKTYLKWAKDNFELNHLPINQHQFIQADCLTWLKQDREQRFDVVLLDPPSFSNSKRMEQVLDVQRDHATLIENGMKQLVKGGVLYFSTNLQSFRLNHDIMVDYHVEDITYQTVDEDFNRPRKPHVCFRITAK